MRRNEYNILAIQRVAGECKAEAADVDTNLGTMEDYVESSRGIMQQALWRNMISAGDSMKNTKNLLEKASDFMTKLGEHLEAMDESLAVKMGE